MKDRQIRILDLMPIDYTFIKIAEVLKVSESTIEKELFWLRDHFRVKTNYGLIAKYLSENKV